MNTKTNLFLVFLAVLLALGSVSAQGSYQIGILPALNLNSKLKNDWSLNTKVESRQLFLKGEFNGNKDQSYNYILTDFSLLAAKKVGLNARIAGGALIRFREEQLFYRFIQQYIFVNTLSNFRLAHRLSSDQTFSENESLEFRLRYRATLEIPLNGGSVDAQEFYLKLNNEYISSWQDADYDFEIRALPVIGYNMKSNNKIETGLDYRLNSFLNNKPRHSFWINFTCYIKI